MFIRNKLYDWKVLTSCSFEIPVISIGNLTTGGTGKTPHTEYLVRLLQNKYNIAMLSRGYKRKSKGFIKATVNSTIDEIGDEPLQCKKKFESITVAVDENRCNGIKEIINNDKNINIILLDDAYQHRAVKPGLSILLTDYFNLFYKNYLLPTGTLREFRFGYKRADIIIVTKTPRTFSPIIRQTLIDEIKLKPYQKIYFSFIKYDSFISLNPLNNEVFKNKYFYILLFAGIANPYPLEDKLKDICSDLTKVYFNDHHNYTVEDIFKIKEKFLNLPGYNKVIVTTEKDAMRLSKPELFEIIKNLPVFYIPIEIDFHKKDKLLFDEQILEFVSDYNI